MKKIFTGLFIMAVFGVLMSASGIGGCGGDGGGSDVNSNFESVDNNATEPTTEIDGVNNDQVTVVESTGDNQGGQIGTIENQDPSSVLCVIVDPAAGDEIDLEVCELDRVNTSTDSVNGLCPEADAVTRCASSVDGSGPDYCQVTGDTDYAFILLNLSDNDSTVAYEVIDVTDLPNQSCADLGITEDSIITDE